MNTELLKSKLLEAAFNGSLTHADTRTWEETTMGDVFTHNTGKALKKDNTEGVLRPYITTSNLYWDRFDMDVVKQMYFKESELEKFTIRKGDLLICEGGDIGRSAIWDFDYEICFQNHVHRLRPRREANVRFYYYIMLYYKWTNRIKGRGIGLEGFSSGVLDKLEVPYPPIAEQQRIVAALEEGFAYIDAVAGAKQNLSNTAELLRSKILQAAFDGSLTGADTSTWEDVKLREVTTKIVDGDHNPPKGEEDPTPYIMLSSQNINDDTYVAMNKVRYLSKENFDMCNKRTHLTKGDVLLTSVGTIGRSCVHNSDEVYCFQRSVTIITPTINSYFLKYYFDSPAFQQMLNMSSTGNAQKGFYLNKLKEVLIPLPSPEEQQRIVSKIEELFTQIDKITK